MRICFQLFLGFLWLNLEVLVEIVDELEDEELSEGGEASQSSVGVSGVGSLLHDGLQVFLEFGMYDLLKRSYFFLCSWQSGSVEACFVDVPYVWATSALAIRAFQLFL